MRALVRLALVVGLALVIAAPAAAQVARVTEGSAKDVSGASTTVTVPTVDCSGANTACKVVLAWRDTGSITFVSFTHAGSSFTTLTTSTCFGGGCLRTAYICNGGGSGNLTATVSAAANTFLGYQKLSGVDCAGTPVGTTTTSNSSGGSATSVTTAVTTTANGMAVDALYIRDEGSTNVPTAGQTQRFTQSDAGSMGLFSSTKPHTATSLGWTWTADGALQYVHDVTPFNAAAGGAPAAASSRLTLGCCE